MVDRPQHLRRTLAAAGSALLLVTLLCLTGVTPARGLSPGVGAVPAAVPQPTGNEAVITVRVGADRTGTTGVTGLAGVTLQLYDGTSSGPTTAVTDSWATCVSDADGDCSFVVPDTQSSNQGCFGASAGANCDRRFWIVQTGVPSGFTQNETFRTGSGAGTGSELTPYRFRTGSTLRAGNTYTSRSNFMIASGNTNRTASGGIWQQSRTNPDPVQQCGLDVALVLDLSGSVDSTELAALKQAASTFTDSLVGTPSQMALFSFASVTPADGATQNYPGLVSVATQSGADAFKARYSSWTSGGGTNWDRALAATAEAEASYDIVVVITDGNPTYYSQPAEGPGNFTRIREMENGVFSANAVKNQGTRVIAVGVGEGVDDTATGQNLRAISGPTAYSGDNATTADYYQVDDYTIVGQALRQLALGDCEGSLSVVKQIVPSGGTIDDATPGGAGWTFSAESQTEDVTLGSTSETTDASSAVNFPLTYAGGVTAGTIEVQEEPHAGLGLFQVDGANAVCTDLVTGDDVTVTNVGETGFTVDVPNTDAVSCRVFNEFAAPASLTVNKEWVINGADPVPEGNQPPGFASALTLTGPGTAGASEQPWGSERSGYVEDEEVTIAEEVTLQQPDIDPDLCEVATPQVVEVNGETVDPVDVPDAGYEVTLAEGSNTYTIRNEVECESRLTLVKNVEGSADPGEWTLSALPAPDEPAGQLPGPSGQAGSAAVTDVPVTAGVPYQLAESGGPPTYLQVDNRTDLQSYPDSTGSWDCIRIDSAGNQLSGFADGINGGVTVPVAERIQCTATNQTAQLTLAKEVVNVAGGTAVPSDFTLIATPGSTPQVEGLEPIEVTGASPEEAEPVEVRPGHPYTLTEESPPGFSQTELDCYVDGTPREDTTQVTLEPGEAVLCIFVNVDEPALLTLRKLVNAGQTGATATPADWTLTATPQGIEDQDPVTGNGADGVTAEPVAAGSYALSESEVDGFDTGQWSCVDGDDQPVTVTGSVVSLVNGAEVTCTITNTAQQPTLTLTKVVENDNGGTAAAADWTLSADGPTPVSGATGEEAVTGAPVAIGSYQLSESGPDGYTAGDWTCTADGTELEVTDATVSIELGQAVECSISNDDEPAQLTLAKLVDAGQTGATAEATEWTLTADGPTSVSGATGSEAVTDAAVDAGQYTLSETGPEGYTASDWTCEGGELSGTTLTIAVGDDVTCTVTNTAEQPTLTLTKVVENDNGGTAAAADWTLSADGPTPVSGATGEEAVTGAPVAIGSYQLAESGPDGYTAGDWTCTADGTELEVTDATVSIGLGQAVECSISNDDEPAQLTLTKQVENAHGGTAEVTEWTLTADGPTPVSGASGSDPVTAATVNAGQYELSETGPEGYTASEWTCEGGELSGTTLTVSLGDEVSCTITNTFDAPQLTLVKEVVDPPGQTSDPTDWTLGATGPETISGATGEPAVTGAAVAPGSYDLFEEGPDGYTSLGWVCENQDGPVAMDGDTITLAVGDDTTCTVTNAHDEAPTPTPTPTPPPSPPPDDILPFTGAAGLWPLVGGLVLVATGGLLVVGSRLRRRSKA